MCFWNWSIAHVRLGEPRQKAAFSNCTPRDLHTRHLCFLIYRNHGNETDDSPRCPSPPGPTPCTHGSGAGMKKHVPDSQLGQHSHGLTGTRGTTLPRTACAAEGTGMGRAASHQRTSRLPAESPSAAQPAGREDPGERAAGWC